ncbi:putative receptor-like protein 8 [Dioscorea cayenensis subsp. rotundata]|uniref:Receptor-like protein 8 n=1 Tax=Dioscorea cayennensis subsp. rotundata TaxID=55577 RepID=A0AB40AVW5_DIOCR|nr:putative receptor-like protein 8 [Dioscorea cayenensis subsp. rotundata]XP_039119208.1 putative receptor-like protein 8 [Dioscorea cayenensis subsp. rotundata]
MKHLQLSFLFSSWLSTLMLLWMLLLVHLVLQQPNGCFACVEQERIALLDIKSAFTDPLSFFMSWNKSFDCCSWYGVHCSPTTKHVRHLNLASAWGNDNSNTLNVSLFLPFWELQHLTLTLNGFNSCIPSDCFGRLEKLNNLEYLDLSKNYFDSKALSSLAALASLKALSLRGLTTEFFINSPLNAHKQSQLESELFINVSEASSKLSKLKYLHPSDNLLNGSIIPYLGQYSLDVFNILFNAVYRNPAL